MKKLNKWVGYLLFSLLISTPIFSVSFAEAGLTVLSEKQEGNTVVYTLRDQKGNEITAVLEGTLSLQAVTGLSGMVKTFSEWTYLKVSSIRMRITPDQIDANIIIQDSSYKGVTLNRHLPAGLQFFLRDTLEYDFRIVSQNNFIRLRGWYFTEVQLLDRLSEAIRNPGQFLKAQDPEFLFNLISVLERDFTDLSAKYEDLSARHKLLSEEHSALAVRHTNLQEKHETLQGLHTSLEESHRDLEVRYQELKASHEELVLNHEELLESHTALEEKHEDLASRHSKLLFGYEESVKELTLLREAALTVANKGVFGTGKPIAPEVVKRILEIQQENPEIEIKDIAKLLKAEELSASSREIFLVLALYLNVYKK